MKSIFTPLLIVLSIHAMSQTILAEHHFESDQIDEVLVEGNFCDVYVSHGDRLVFDGIIKGNGQKGDFLIASIESGHSVVFKVERKAADHFFQGSQTARLDLIIPDGVSLTVRNSSGDVDIQHFDGDKLDVTASSGDLSMDDIHCDVKLETSSGDLNLKHVIGNVTMRSSSGDQQFAHLQGNLLTHATSGNILIEDLKGDLRAEATSGDMTLNHIEGELDVNTTSGDIRGESVILKGNSFMKSTSGDIRFVLENDVTTLKFTMKATSGDIRVQDRHSENSLALGNGSTTVTCVSTSGDQIFTN